MKRRFKLKINGESPRSLFLAFVLAKIKCDVYLYDFVINTNSNNYDQIFSFSNFSRNLLSKLDNWNEFENISYSFTSLSIKDNLVSDQLLLRTENSPEKNINAFGWTAKYSDFKNLLINKFINYDNVHFISKDQLTNESPIFDYEFNFIDYKKIYNLCKFPFSILKKIDDYILIFHAYVRGNVEKRLYEINTTDGLLILTPINKNFYQIIWNNASVKIKERSLKSKSFFLDNLTNLLPSELKIDQIIGEINSIQTCNISSTYSIKKNLIYFNENKFNSNILYDFEFDKIVINIIQIFNFFNNKELKNFRILNKLGFYFLLRKFLELIINFSLLNFIIKLLSLNNIFSLFFRKLLFILFKKINLLKFFIMKKVINTNIYKLIK